MVLWGGLFAWLAGILPDGYILKGIILGLIAWLLMMLLVMPMAGAGLFTMNLGIMAPAMTLILHVIFGAVLGYSYARLPIIGTTAPVH